MHSILEYQLFILGEYHFTLAMLMGLILVWLLTTLFLRTIRRVINRDGGTRLLNLSDKGRRMSLYLLAKYMIWTVAVAVMLEIIGIHISVLLAGSAALLVGLGLGVQPIFRDIVSGIFLLFEGTIEIGDIIKLDGEIGRVKEINLRTSKLITRDGHTMIVPNHKFITENVMNWTHQEMHSAAFRVQVRVGYDVDGQQLTEVLNSVLMAHSDVLTKDPERMPQVALLEFQEKCVLYEVRFWTEKQFDADQVQSALRFAIHEQMRKLGISLPKE